MNLHELIKGLPIKVISRDEVEFDGDASHRLGREYLERQVNNDKRALEFRVRDRLLLALMDEQPPKFDETLERKDHEEWMAAHRKEFCGHVPTPEERPNPWPDVVLSDVPGALNALARRTNTLLERVEWRFKL